MLLRGLRFYTVNTTASGESPAAQQAGGAAGDGGGKAPNRKERRAERAARQQLDLHGAENIMSMALDADVCRSLGYFDAFERCLDLLGLLLLAVFVTTVLRRVGLVAEMVSVGYFAAFAPLLAFYWLLDAECGGYLGIFTRAHLLLLFLSAPVAVMALLLVPRAAAVLNFDATAAAADATALVQRVLSQAAEKLGDSGRVTIDAAAADTYVVEPFMLAGVAAATAAVATPALLNAAMWYARLLFVSTKVPEWGGRYMSRGYLAVKAAQAGFVLPLLAALSAVKPVTDYYGVGGPALLVIQPALFSAAAVAQLAALRPLMQTYLDSSLAEWHRLKHDGSENPGRGEMLRVRCTLILYAMFRVALRLVAPPVALLGLAAWALLKGASAPRAEALLAAVIPEPLIKLPSWADKHDASAAPAAEASSSSSPPAAGALSCQFLASFVGCWCATAWFASACLNLFVLRMGITSASPSSRGSMAAMQAAAVVAPRR